MKYVEEQTDKRYFPVMHGHYETCVARHMSAAVRTQRCTWHVVHHLTNSMQ